MGLFDRFKKKTPAPDAEQKPAKVSKKSAKDIATEKGEPWVNVTGLTMDPANITDGAFDLDWNDIFIAKLIRAGYQGKTDVDLVDQWFQSICRNVVLESFEQQQADPEKRDNRKIIGDGRSEIS